MNDPNPTAQPASNPGVVSSEIVSRILALHHETIPKLFPNVATNIGWGCSHTGVASKVEGIGIISTEQVGNVLKTTIINS